MHESTAPPPRTTSPEAAPLAAEPRAKALWLAFLLSPGLLAFAGASWKLAFNDERSAPEWIAFLFCAALLGANGGALAIAPIRRWALRQRHGLLATAISTLLALGAAEWALQRIMVPPQAKGEGSIYRVDDELGFAHEPNSRCRQSLGRVFDVEYEINALGTRGPAWDAPRGEGEKFLLALGCSQTFGHGVKAEETWPARLEGRLGDGWRVANAGVAAYGPQQFYLLGRRLATVRKPDAIVVGLGSFHLSRLGCDPAWDANIGNFGLRLPVLGRNEEGAFVASKLVPESVVPREEATVFHRDAAPRPFESQLYLFAKRALLAAGRWAQSMAGSPPAREEAKPTAAQREALDLVLAAYGELKRSTGARVVLLLLPESGDRDGAEQKAFREIVEAGAKREGLECWDVRDDFDAALHGASMMLNPFYERHYAPAAHEALAAVVAKRLR
jgi:hypothetical protein